MENWTTAMKRGVLSGSSASVISTLALAALGKRETNSMFAPTNAVSHWIWGDKAFNHNGPSLRYTVTGYLIHHASATFWGVLFERLLGRKLDNKGVAATLATSAAATAVACLTDYKLTPQRLQPGFDERLSKESVALVYGAFAVGLFAATMLMHRKQDK
ncbi:hypothetical protein KY495_08880 [Massilia sp. PAMC28688]|uniref:hypothetical protein n=1 Tax=Massilia sp. PAMC28688 TaxID=2861283 RepID=UPI001C639778|nr:hypothetical protein [Massilia sp. PAMC28688]QYF95247.1 hypothetical protein KY495_08880 [Massilia sp. PAMC28688]